MWFRILFFVVFMVLLQFFILSFENETKETKTMVKDEITYNPTNVTCSLRGEFIALDETWSIKGEFVQNSKNNALVPLRDCMFIIKKN